jgi:hypothetical protein
MNDLSRRDAVKLLAGVVAGASVFSADEVPGQEAGRGAERLPPIKFDDPELEQALKNPEAFMLAKQATSNTRTDGNNYDLVITSAARDARGSLVYVPPGSMRIFRADSDRDEFTKKGGLYWRCGDIESRIQFKQPGPLVMVVREQSGTVHWYSLAPDYRC